MFTAKSIKSRNLMFSGLLIVTVVVLITSIFYITERNRLIDERMNVIQLEVERESIFVEREFSKIYENAQALSFTVNDMIDTTYSNEREHLFSISERIVDGNPNIVGVNFVFEEDVIDNDNDFIGDDRFQSDGQFISYVSKEHSELSIEYIENYDSYEFYIKAMSLKDDFFTEPYYFNIENEEKYISTVVFPIVEQGEFLGLVGIDFTADFIFDRMLLLDSTYIRRDIIASQNGTILLNTEDISDFNGNISYLYPDYQASIINAESNGGTIEKRDDGNLSIIQTIELASTGSNWYIFSEVEQSVLTQELNAVFFQTAGIGLLSLIIGLLALYFINAKSIKPITTLADKVEGYDIEHGHINDFSVETEGLQEIDSLYNAFYSSIQIVQRTLGENKNSLMIQTKQLNIQEVLEKQSNLSTLCDAIIDTLLTETNSLIGGLYLYKDDHLSLCATSGLDAKHIKDVELGQGLIGQVAKTQKPKYITYPEKHDFWVNFGMDEIQPPHILIYPLVQQEELIGVIQLISLESFADYVETLLDESNFMIAASIVKQENKESTDALLIETQQLAKELDEKQKDLEVQNEELETQQEELRVTNEELETQQEELRVTNEELETQQEELRVANDELQVNMNKVETINEELEKTRNQLEKRTLEAERSNKYKSDFLANMSHELRTPLNSILILSNLISEQDQASPKMTEYANTIHSSGKDLLELINGILDLAKVESGKEKAKIADTNLHSLIEDLENRYRPLAEKHDIDLSVDVPSELPNIKTDGSKLKLILTNLLSNALKFTEEGTVGLSIREEDKEMIFKVTDTGIGIEADKLDSIFEEFHQIESDSNRSFGGTGLGLSICNRYASLLNGRITVDSEVGKGSTFTLILPINNESSVDEPSQNSKKSKKDKKTTLTEKNVILDDRRNVEVGDASVLIISEDDNFLESLRDKFKKEHLNSIVSNTGENGLYLADYYLPSMIVIDDYLTTIDTETLVDKLHSNKRLSFSKIAIFTDNKDKLNVTDANILLKPVTKKSLTSIVEDIKHMPKRTSRILLVEDNEVQRQAVVDYLNSHKSDMDFDIDTASTKKETLSLLDNSYYELMVVDLKLDDTTEYNLIETIRDEDKYKKIPIIVYTGKEFKQEEEEKLSEMVQDIIIKGEQSTARLLQDIQLYMSQKNKHSLVTDKILFKGKKVLVVDDDMRNIFAVTGLLENYDIQTVYSTSGQDAIEQLRSQDDIDLVLMDIMMPEMNGYETMEKIRQEEHMIDIPIIALTAKSMRGDREKCIQAGANEYLSKPLNKDKLLSVLRVWL